MNETIHDFSADDFREVFLYSIFDYLHENGMKLTKIEDVFARYQEDKIAQSINIALSVVVERIVDLFLLSQSVLKEEQLGTKLESEFSIQGSSSTGKPSISSKFKLFYKQKNLHFILHCQMVLNDLFDNEKLDKWMGRIRKDVEEQLSR
ncbi:hypothetical protein [Neobacillus sp. LXY-4]|uniref:hypothetical protein n=1 Tax=Neobacillus sp. LXY-4 TaxID=3379826 RepID=UPI003EE3F9D8